MVSLDLYVFGVRCAVRHLVFRRPGVDVDVEVNRSRVQKKGGLPPSQGLDDLAEHNLDGHGRFGRGTNLSWHEPARNLLHCGLTLKLVTGA